jgi:peroxiredoxin
MGSPDVGAPAPDFTLPSTAGTQVKLSDLKGKKVLLAFFPLAFTSTCTTELNAFNNDFGQFGETVVLPISVDSVPTLKEFKAKEQLNFDLLSDFKRDVSRLYGTLLEEKFYSNRAYFLVDRKGVLRWAFVEPTPGSRRENAEILKQINAVE